MSIEVCICVWQGLIWSHSFSWMSFPWGASERSKDPHPSRWRTDSTERPTSRSQPGTDTWFSEWFILVTVHVYMVRNAYNSLELHVHLICIHALDELKLQMSHKHTHTHNLVDIHNLCFRCYIITGQRQVLSGSEQLLITQKQTCLNPCRSAPAEHCIPRQPVSLTHK